MRFFPNAENSHTPIRTLKGEWRINPPFYKSTAYNARSVGLFATNKPSAMAVGAGGGSNIVTNYSFVSNNGGLLTATTSVSRTACGVASGDRNALFIGGFSLSSMDIFKWDTSTVSALTTTTSKACGLSVSPTDKTRILLVEGRATNACDMIPWSTMIGSNSPASLPVAPRYYMGCVTDGTTIFYGGGYNPSTGSVITSCEQVPWATGIAASLPAVFATGRAQLGYATDKTIAYFSGGTNGIVNYSSTEKLTWSTLSISVGPDLGTAYQYSACSDGQTMGVGNYNVVNKKVVFSTGVVSTPPTGYFIMGYSSSNCAANTGF